MSAACLAGEEFDLSPHIERLLHRQSSRRMLELNPAHPIVQALQERCQRDEGDPMLAVAADVLFGLAVLSEGSDLPDPVSFREGITRLLDSCLRSGAPVGDEGAVIRSS
jgi:molecular chaperone HtpG